VKQTTVVDVGVKDSVATFEHVVLPERRVINAGEDRTAAIARTQDEGERYLETAAKSLRDAGVEVEPRVEITEGDVAETISNYAASNGYDLIAMSTHAREGISRLFSGSVAGKVLELAPMPVLLVRAPES
jgi:nucleotide-binding universal stress UspA family protein